MNSHLVAYVGSRTNAKRQASGQGIVVFDVPSDGLWREKQVIKMNDPSFLCLDRTRKFLFAVEGDGSTVSGFLRRGDGRLELVSTCDARGVNGVYLLPDPSNRFMIVVNHGAKDGKPGNIAVFPLAKDGSLGPATDVYVIEGEPGPNRVEQMSSKPHHAQFSPDGAFLAVTDKGLDVVMVLRLSEAGRLEPVEGGRVRLRWGCAPRHLRFNPRSPALYVLNELDSTITTLRFEPGTGKVEPIQVLMSQSDDYYPVHRASDVVVSACGRFVYAANRGENSIGVFAADETRSGRLHPVHFEPCGGAVPRYLCMFEDETLFVANEFSHNIASFDVGEDGRLTPTGDVAKTGSPTCVLLA